MFYIDQEGSEGLLNTCTEITRSVLQNGNGEAEIDVQIGKDFKFKLKTVIKEKNTEQKDVDSEKEEKRKEKEVEPVKDKATDWRKMEKQSQRKYKYYCLVCYNPFKTIQGLGEHAIRCEGNDEEQATRTEAQEGKQGNEKHHGTDESRRENTEWECGVCGKDMKSRFHVQCDIAPVCWNCAVKTITGGDPKYMSAQTHLL